MKRQRVRILMTPGDPNGIGPEITHQAFEAFKNHPWLELVGIGAAHSFQTRTIHSLSPNELKTNQALSKKTLPFIKAPEDGSPGAQAGWAIEKATRLLHQDQADALVTGPISKERLQAGGYPFQGHTDFLAHLCGFSEVTMMLANSYLKVSLVTVHTPLEKVSEQITFQKLRQTLIHTRDALKLYWKKHCPRIAICALNPHAGEGGMLGEEENKVIRPFIKTFQKDAQGEVAVSGPYAADTLFAKDQAASARHRFDAIIAMYHDQGLIPVKLIDFSNTVNITLGLPLIRTSVDHGVAFDLAGKGVADASSMKAAVQQAYQMVKKARSFS